MNRQPPATLNPFEGERLHFGRYVLDIGRGQLMRDERELLLRPKTFAVLRHLLANAGRLVSKDELFAAVWPNLAVTDDVLVQSISELRRALAPDGSSLIRTVPRRGYRLDAGVGAFGEANGEPVDAVTGAGSAPSGSPAPSSSLSPAFSGPARPRRVLADAVGHGGARPLLIVAALLTLLAFPIALWMPGVSRPTVAGFTPSTDSQLRSAARPAIAVLPFGSENGAAQDYFADGLTQDLINALGRFSALTVMSWNAVLPYKGRSAPPREIGRVLAVRYQVESRLQQSADRLRVSAQLVDADGRVLWSGRFDEAPADVFLLQDKLVGQIAGALAVRVAQHEQQRASAKPVPQLQAYDLVLKARPALQRPSRRGNSEARELLRRAIELDPDYASAHASLAETYYIDVSQGWAQSPVATLARAEALANKALGLDASEVRARVLLGRIHILHHRHDQAKAELERAIAINPSDAKGLAGFGNALMWQGEAERAIETLEQAQRIDPELSAIDRFSLGLAYYAKRRYEAAITQAQFNLQASGEAHFNLAVLAAAHAQKGQADEAARAVQSLRRQDPTFRAQDFGTKFLGPADLEHLREGLRKAQL